MNSTLLPIHVDEGYSGKDLEEDEEEVERGKEKTSKRDCYKKKITRTTVSNSEEANAVPVGRKCSLVIEVAESKMMKTTGDAIDAGIVVVYRQACSGIPLAVGFVGKDRRLWNSMVQGTQRFRQVRAASCVIPYVLCGGLYCLRCRCLSRGVPARPYISGGTWLHGKS